MIINEMKEAHEQQQQKIAHQNENDDSKSVASPCWNQPRIQSTSQWKKKKQMKETLTHTESIWQTSLCWMRSNARERDKTKISQRRYNWKMDVFLGIRRTFSPRSRIERIKFTWKTKQFFFALAFGKIRCSFHRNSFICLLFMLSIIIDRDRERARLLGLVKSFW